MLQVTCFELENKLMQEYSANLAIIEFSKKAFKKKEEINRMTLPPLDINAMWICPLLMEMYMRIETNICLK